MFDQATRQKLRYNYNGQISTEDLWDLSLEALNQIAIFNKRAVDDLDGEDFIGGSDRNAKARALVQLRLDVVKAVIAVKLEERDERAAAVEKAAKRRRILEILARKEDQALQEKSTEDLLKELEAL